MEFSDFLQPKYLLIGGVAVIGGLFLASKFKPKEQPAVEAVPISQPYAVANTEGYSPSQGLPGSDTVPQPGRTPPPTSTTTPTAPRPTPNVPPGAPAPGTTIPHVPNVPTPMPGTPRREPTPAPPGPPPATPNVPGGFPADCRGTQHIPPDYLDRRRMPSDTFAHRSVKLAWAVMNLGFGPPGIYGLTEWISNPAVWPTFNLTRRNRGLRALTETEIKRLIVDLNTIIITLQGKENRLTDAQILSIWDKWNTPYLCNAG